MGDQPLGVFDVGDVDNEGVGGGAALGFVDAGDRLWVGGVGTEAINGFGGEGDEAALFEEMDGLLDHGRVQGSVHEFLLF